MLELSRLNSFYQRSHILHDISIKIEQGAIHTILGRNGVGKTTLLKTIMGLTDRVIGSMMLDGVEIAQLETFQRSRAGVAYVPQGREIIPDFTIRENILLGCFARDDGIREIPEIVPELFPYLMENLSRPGGVLSGGQQQQLAIARALAVNPKILLLDEPTEGIQPNIVEQIKQTIQVLNQKFNLTIILVEQNVEFARKASHHFSMMENGRVVADGAVDSLSEKLVHTHMMI